MRKTKYDYKIGFDMESGRRWKMEAWLGGKIKGNWTNRDVTGKNSQGNKSAGDCLLMTYTFQ